MPDDASSQPPNVTVQPKRRSRRIVRAAVAVAVLAIVLLAVRSSLVAAYRVAGARCRSVSLEEMFIELVGGQG